MAITGSATSRSGANDVRGTLRWWALGALTLSILVIVGAKPIILVGMVVSAVGLVLLSQLHAGSGYGSVALGLVVFGLGLGLSIPLSVDVVLSVLPLSQAGTGNGMSRTMQNIAVSFSSAIIGSMLNSGYRDKIVDAVRDLPGAARDAASASVAGAHGVAGGLPADAGGRLTQAANTAYAHGMTQSLVASAAILGVFAVLTLLFLPKRKTRPAEVELELVDPADDAVKSS
ncbi:hypothetical protein ACWC9T_40190 [Kitasatospora sp. NPDC001159]